MRLSERMEAWAAAFRLCADSDRSEMSVTPEACADLAEILEKAAFELDGDLDAHYHDWLSRQKPTAFCSKRLL